MKLEKRDSTSPEQPENFTPETAEPSCGKEPIVGKEPVAGKPPVAGKKPVIVYIMILFIAAFLLMALSFLMHQRSNTEALGELQSSVSDLREVQATQDKNILLQEELGDAKKEIDALDNSLEKSRQETADAQLCNQALLFLHALQQQYFSSDYDACRQTLQAMDDAKLPELLPKDAAKGVTPPHQRYEQLREAIMNH